ncbi:MAG TPA: prephenate dehydratase domain-containing protein [Acidimicrobiia bacterium]|nr:prephenate dehydratase domain-containing protein [Acidimicrobiia bacterium]
MRVGYQGEELSYSDQAASELFGAETRIGFPTFVSAFEALRDGVVDRLVMPIENSTTGSVLPVLDRLVPGQVHIVAEHLIEVRHALLGLHGAALEGIKRVRSHPEALAQAEAILTHWGWEPLPAHDTAGAVRLVAEQADPADAALAPERVAEPFGLTVLLRDVVDRPHNTTRFVVLVQGEQPIAGDADKTSVAFTTAHTPGALALALTELGLRGANLTRIESRPTDEAWRYRMFVDLTHPPGPAGVARVFEPMPATLADLRFLGSYRSVLK